MTEWGRTKIVAGKNDAGERVERTYLKHDSGSSPENTTGDEVWLLIEEKPIPPKDLDPGFYEVVEDEGVDPPSPKTSREVSPDLLTEVKDMTEVLGQIIKMLEQEYRMTRSRDNEQNTENKKREAKPIKNRVFLSEPKSGLNLARAHIQNAHMTLDDTDKLRIELLDLGVRHSCFLDMLILISRAQEHMDTALEYLQGVQEGLTLMGCQDD